MLLLPSLFRKIRSLFSFIFLGFYSLFQLQTSFFATSCFRRSPLFTYRYSIVNKFLSLLIPIDHVVPVDSNVTYLFRSSITTWNVSEETVSVIYVLFFHSINGEVRKYDLRFKDSSLICRTSTRMAAFDVHHTADIFAW